ncbi:unnamed protein product, partial [Staurois parvus]
MSLTLVISGKNAPYIGDQWEECPLHWCQWEECPLHWCQWEECPLHWCSVGRMSLTLVISGKNVPYIG